MVPPARDILVNVTIFRVKCSFQPYACNTTYVMYITQCTQEVANDMAGICHVIWAFVKLEACFGSCDKCVNLALHDTLRKILHFVLRA